MSGERLVWPDWMPLPQVTGYGFQPVDRRLKTEMEIGGLVRVQFDTDETQCQCQLFLDSDEAAWFEAFERDLLAQGSAWFELPLWIAGQIQTHVVRLRERPSTGDKFGCYLTYSLSLEIARRKLICPAYAQLMLSYSPLELRYYQAFLRRLTTTVMPGITNVPADIWPK